MDDVPSALLGRLDAIAAALAHRDGTLALLGVGSVGADLSRLDAYSDLDFFVIVEPGYTERLVGALDWLQEAAPVAFAFQNTQDGCKVLFEDGIYAEFAVFDRERLRSIPLDGARVVWKREGVGISDIVAHRSPPPEMPPTEWLIGEILTNLYVGLTRLRRGEALSAQRLIQVHAVDRLLDLCASLEAASPVSRDPFDRARRAERRFPGAAPSFARSMQGYSRSPESALAILEFVEDRFPVNPAIACRIRELAGR